ncbi:MAG: T9SS type A sorting domain-containing protein, partial [Flavobacteriales bacterium]|nr:T9SS type A sorting domain-containing protein [Flavobacteriales bacterium]
IAGSSLLYVNDLGDPPTIEIDGMPLGICGSSSTSIDKIGHEQLSVYPNPANNYLQIESVDPIDAVHLYTLCGQRVLSEIPGGKQRITLNTASLDAGLYLLETVTSGGTGKRHRIVIR